MKIPEAPPDFHEIWRRTLPDTDRLMALADVKATDLQGRYLHWDELRRREPPTGLTHEQYWAGTKIARNFLLKDVPLLDKAGSHFRYAEPDSVRRALHDIDSRTRGRIAVEEPILNHDTKRYYLVKSLIEEAFNSSLIEGAATTRQAAREMVRDGRKPRTRDERMVLNNYRAMEFIQSVKADPLTPQIILELHRIITEQTLDDPEGAGKYRTSIDRIDVVDPRDNTLLHMPPDADELPGRMERLCDFANAKNDGEQFIHPITRAIILHFMLAYDHPFVDGNGRTARALFYWCVIRNGYWLLEFTSISRVIAKSITQYARAYLHTETDENDLTYFIVYHMKVLNQSIDELEIYLEGKIKEKQEIETLLSGSKYEKAFNHRQKAILEYAVQHPGTVLTIKQHQNLNGISYHTARNDLESLARCKLLKKTSTGRETIYITPRDIAEKMKQD